MGCAPSSPAHIPLNKVADSSQSETSKDLRAEVKRLTEENEGLKRLTAQLTALAERKELKDQLTVGEVLKLMYPDAKEPFLAAKCEGDMVHMNSVHSSSRSLTPVHLASPGGLAIYRQTLCFVLVMAAKAVFPNRTLRLEHGFGVESTSLARGYYCQFADDTPVTDDDVARITDRMKQIIAQNIPIAEKMVARIDAMEQLVKMNLEYSAALVRSRARAFVNLNTCGEYECLSHRERGRVLGPSTGSISVFGLRKHAEGLSLAFPVFDAQGKLVVEEVVGNPLIWRAYKETNMWAAKLGIDSIGALNSTIIEGGAKDFVHAVEAVHGANIVNIARAIFEQAERGQVRLVLIGGPSSSGKTTFANKLRTQLTAFGMKPIMFSTDDYYRPNSDPDYPLDANGIKDFENIRALRLDLLNEHLDKLLNGEEVKAPLFDFVAGQPKVETRRLKLPPRGVLIAEGIFCLNDLLTTKIPDNRKFRIYVSPMSQLNIDELSYVSNQLLRLIRRISRDHKFRGRTAQATIYKWPMVRTGEEVNIYPHVARADAIYNSACDYELPVLKVHVEPLLESVPPSAKEYTIAQELKGMLALFQPIPDGLVPSTSLIREFIGGSDWE